MSISSQGGMPPKMQLTYGGKLLIAPLLPRPIDVRGFDAGSDELSQHQVDAAMQRLSEFVDASPADDQEVYVALFEQARAYADDHWPAG